MDSEGHTANTTTREQPATTSTVSDPSAGSGNGSGNESYLDTAKQYITPITESVTSQAAPGETLEKFGTQVREIATGVVKKTDTEIESLDPAEKERIDNAEKERIEEFLKEQHKSTNGVMAPVE